MQDYSTTFKTVGSITYLGTTSGSVIVKAAAVAGAWTLTLPASAGTANYPLITNGSGVSSWAVLPASGGGTGVTTFDTGELLVGNGSGTVTRLGIGTAGQILTVAGGTATWAAGTGATFANPSASVGLTAVNGAATTAMRSDGAPALSVAIEPNWTGFHSHQFDSLGTTQDDVKGILLFNNTAAANGAQQISPSLRWRGNGWKTDATAASRQVSVRAWLLPVQGAANPSGTFKLQSEINDTDVFTDILTVTTAGLMTVSSASITGNLNLAGSAGANSLMTTGVSSDVTGITSVRGTIAQGGITSWVALAIGTSGKVLTSDGTDVSWQTPGLSRGITKVTASTTVASTHDIIIVDMASSGGNVTITFPTGLVNGKIITLIKTTSNANTLFVAASGSATLNNPVTWTAGIGGTTQPTCSWFYETATTTWWAISHEQGS
jgi:hypothetical protein